jgi:hypothetical protein
MIPTRVQNHDDIIIYHTVSTCSRASIFGAFQHSPEHKQLTARLKADIMPAPKYQSVSQNESEYQR